MTFSFLPGAEQRKANKLAKQQAERQAAEQEQLRRQRLVAAAGVSAVTVRCHVDLWDEVSKIMALPGGVRWRAPKVVNQLPKDLVEVRISGPNVTVALAHLYEVAGRSFVHGDARSSVARRFYQQLAVVVDQVDPDNPGRPLPPVVLDDVAAAEDGATSVAD